MLQLLHTAGHPPSHPASCGSYGQNPRPLVDPMPLAVSGVPRGYLARWFLRGRPTFSGLRVSARALYRCCLLPLETSIKHFLLPD